MDTTRKILGMVLVLLVCFCTQADLKGRIDSLLAASSQSKVSYSVVVKNARTGKTIYEHNAYKPLIPASNMKVITTGAALAFLKGDYEFKTIAGLSGDTLVIIGGGDPLLGDPELDKIYNKTSGWIIREIADKVQQKGITGIDHITVDSSIFEDIRSHPNWPADQLNRWYACEVSGLNYNDNCVAMTIIKKDGRAVVEVLPQTSFLKLTNNVTVISSGNEAVGAYRTPRPNELVIKGKCKLQQGPFDVAIERPAAFFGYLVAEELLRRDIKTKGNLVEGPFTADKQFEVLGVYCTPLSDVLARCNKDSLGLAAECLMKTMSAKANGTGKQGSWAQGKAVLEGFLKQLGVNENEFKIDDASGLSRENRLSANALAIVLKSAYDNSNWQMYKDSMAIGGVDGTIRKYFSQPKYKGKIIGKTGYIAGVKSFSGYCLTENGDFIFAAVANNANGPSRETINSVAQAVIDEMGK